MKYKISYSSYHFLCMLFLLLHTNEVKLLLIILSIIDCWTIRRKWYTNCMGFRSKFCSDVVKFGLTFCSYDIPLKIFRPEHVWVDIVATHLVILSLTLINFFLICSFCSRLFQQFCWINRVYRCLKVALIFRTIVELILHKNQR